MPDKFPIGAWVKDPNQATLSGGMGWSNTGRRTFLPYRGQVVSWGKVGKLPGYRIKFGETLNVIPVAEAECDSCGTTDESKHHAACFEAFRRGKCQ